MPADDLPGLGIDQGMPPALRLLYHTIPMPIPPLDAPTKEHWPVWAGSVANPVRFVPLAKKAAVRLWHRARDFDRGTHQAGRHGGAVGAAAMQVLHALVFDFLNHRTGRLDPSYAAIAAKAGVCVRTVATALAKLRDLGILNWVRRRAERWADGRFVLEQETNAYAVLPESQWRGYRAPLEAPTAPWPDTWGATPPLPSALVLAALEGDPAGKAHVLAVNAMTPLERALACFQRSILARDS